MTDHTHTRDEDRCPLCPSIDMVNHPPHYEPMSGVDFDCITVVRDMTFDTGNAVKYMWRADRKNGREDIEKARWYLKDAIANFDCVWIDSTALDWDARMIALVDAQTDPDRAAFFDSIRLGGLHGALLALERMLK